MSLAPASIVRAPTISVLSRPTFVEPMHLTVQWVGDATDGERLAAYAGRLRSSSYANPAARSTREYLQQLSTDELGPLIAHAHYSLLIEGVSRTLAHELLREGAGCKWTERLPRYVDDEAVRFVVPPAIDGDAALEAAWSARMAAALNDYTAMVDALMTRYGWIGDKVQRRKVAREAAGSLLPQSTETTLIVTGSLRAWHTVLLRCANETAELEMRRLALSIVAVMQHETPALFDRVATYLSSDRFPAGRTREL